MDDTTLTSYQGSLTVTLGPEVGLHTFATALDKLANFLRDLEPARPEGKLRWFVADLGRGSARVSVRAHGDPRVAAIISRRAFDGLRALENAEDLPRAFPLEAVEAASAFLQIVAKDRLRAVVEADGQEQELTNRALLTAQGLLRTVVWEDLGSIEGSLETITVHGGNQFNLWEAVTGRRVECYFRADQLEDVKAALGRRVRVEGRIRYNRRGEFTSIEVRSLEIIPRDEDLPPLDEMAGIAPNITGDLSSEDYVRRLRDEH